MVSYQEEVVGSAGDDATGDWVSCSSLEPTRSRGSTCIADFGAHQRQRIEMHPAFHESVKSGGELEEVAAE